MTTLEHYILDSTKQESVFNGASGIEFSLEADQLKYSEIFILAHRGSDLKAEQIEIGDLDQFPVPLIRLENATKDLEDGAWVLFRVRRTATSDSERSWSKPIRLWQRELKKQVRTVQHSFDKRDAAVIALAALCPDPSGRMNLYSASQFLQELIEKDSMLIEADVDRHIVKIEQMLQDARNRIASLIDLSPNEQHTLDANRNPQKEFQRIMEPPSNLLPSRPLKRLPPSKP